MKKIAVVNKTCFICAMIENMKMNERKKKRKKEKNEERNNNNEVINSNSCS